MIIVEYHTTRSTTSLVPVIIVAHWSDSDSRFEKLRQWEWEGCWIPHNTLRHFISTCDCCTTLTARWQQGGLTEKSVEYHTTPYATSSALMIVVPHWSHSDIRVAWLRLWEDLNTTEIPMPLVHQYLWLWCHTNCTVIYQGGLTEKTAEYHTKPCSTSSVLVIVVPQWQQGGSTWPGKFEYLMVI